MKPALKLLCLVWDKNHTTAWEALNHCMSKALQLAIGAKLDWQPSNFDYINNHMRPGYWQGEHGWERYYALAVATDGTAFIKAFETWSKRQPFFANEVQSDYSSTKGFVHANSAHRQRGRIYLWAEVFINGERFKCTSISNERVILTCRREGKKGSILKLDHDDCARMWPAPKKKKKTPEKEQECATSSSPSTI